MGTKLVSYSLTEPSKVILPVIGEVALEYARELRRDPRTTSHQRGYHVEPIFPPSENRIDSNKGVAERTETRTSGKNAPTGGVGRL